MEKISVYQVGSRMHYAIPNMLEEMDMLDRLYTDVIGNKGWIGTLGMIPDKFLPTGLVKLKNRKPNVPLSKITHYPLFGLKIGNQLRKASSLEENLQIFLDYNKEFSRKIIQGGLPKSDCVYAFNTAALELFHAHGDSTFKILEQTIAPFAIEKEIVEEEIEKYSGWVKGELDYNSPAAKEFADREKQEIVLADSIICASKFVADGIIKLGGDPELINVVPYGVNLDFFKEKKRDRTISSRKIKVLTVGRIGLRKGIQYVYEAAKELKNEVEFTVVGPIELSGKALSEISDYVSIVSSVSKTELLEYYNSSDLFLLPSLCEGSATVVYEALACGLPVITTYNSGTIIENNVEGLVVPIKNHEAIVESILRFKNREFLEETIKNARKTSEKASFESYKARVAEFLNQIEVK